MRVARDAARFGFRAGEPEADLPALRERLHSLIDDFRRDRLQAMNEARYALLRGKARFLSTREIELQEPGAGTRVLEARTFVVATGSEPVVPRSRV
jgi:pyruvate/2-oxoglutarate dehydrogenase complex dihydrolipoamide dehydrogenase (E3) component